MEKAPVYKVISDFPGNKDFPVNSIITFSDFNGSYWRYSVSDCQGERTYTPQFLDKYPAIFKKVSPCGGPKCGVSKNNPPGLQMFR